MIRMFQCVSTLFTVPVDSEDALSPSSSAHLSLHPATTNYYAKQERDSITAIFTRPNATNKLIAICIIIIIVTACGIHLFLSLLHSHRHHIGLRDLVQCLQFISFVRV